MAREIKFRAWDVERRMMYRVAILSLTPDEPGSVQLDDGDWRAGKDVVLMQFTGLKDKNGKEIYEGDIVHTDEFSEKGENAEVWFTPQGMWVFGDAEKGSGECFLDARHYEVIGNIYENPELLKQ